MAPVDDEEVFIPSDVHMIYDIEESPELGYLEVNGKLTFQNDDIDRVLKAHSIWVRGEMEIGTHADPFRSKANIHLLGDGSRDHLVVS